MSDNTPIGLVSASGGGVKDNSKNHAQKVSMKFPRPLRIMLADDQKLFADTVVAFLHQKWPTAAIDTAIDYVSLFRSLNESAPYDFIIADLQMPKVNIETSIEQLRRFAPNAVLILISGSADALEIGKALSTGIDAFVHKNQGADDLVETVERFLSDRSLDQSTSATRQNPNNERARFSRREWQTLNLIATGLETKEIAQKLEIAPTTVKIYIKSLLKKTGCPNRTGLAVFAIQSGILERSNE